MRAIIDVFQNTIMGNMICDKIEVFYFAMSLIKEAQIESDVTIIDYNKCNKTYTVSFDGKEFKIKIAEVNEEY